MYFICIMNANKIVHYPECRRYMCLNGHAILCKMCQDHEALFEDTKDSFNGILCCSMLKIVEFLLIDRPICVAVNFT